MQHWMPQAGDKRCVWHAQNEPHNLYVLVTCRDGTWDAFCLSIQSTNGWGDTFRSQLATEKGLDRCLDFVQKTLRDHEAPEFDIAEAKQLLSPLLKDQEAA